MSYYQYVYIMYPDSINVLLIYRKTFVHIYITIKNFSILFTDRLMIEHNI